MPDYKVIIDGKQMGVTADSGYLAIRDAISTVRPSDLEQRLQDPPEGKSYRVTISISRLDVTEG